MSCEDGVDIRVDETLVYSLAISTYKLFPARVSLSPPNWLTGDLGSLQGPVLAGIHSPKTSALPPLIQRLELSI